ncbi:MAG: orotidine-5-phosphate decarboxylase [Pseudomonadota bacterium]|jgi:orotidine-5'-phosphate decarboxylase
MNNNTDISSEQLTHPAIVALLGCAVSSFVPSGPHPSVKFHAMTSHSFIPSLQRAAVQNQSLLCVGLDPEPRRFPSPFGADSKRIFDFCAAIVDATADVAMAFKPQIAYFAAHRAEDQLERLIAHIRQAAPHVPVILDAKRGDIGSTAEQYACEAFERYGADAVTLSPFMGFDSVEPYLRYRDKGVFLLCRTSNPGGDDLQAQRLASVEGQPRVYEHIARLAQGPWNTNGQVGLVVGATYPAEIARVRELAPTLPLLIPGVGAQGGDAHATVQAGLTAQGLIAVNSSRAILYASAGADFAQAARREALATRERLNTARP